MKYFICVALFLLVNAQGGQSQLFVNFIDRLGRTAQRTAEAYCPESKESIQGAVDEARTCLHNWDFENHTVCAGVQIHLEKCVQPLTKAAEQCLPQESRKLPALLLKALLNELKYICDTQGEMLIELLNPCMIDKVVGGHRTNATCLDTIETEFRNTFGQTLPSSTVLCNGVEKLGICMKELLNESCKNPMTKKAYMDLFNSVASVCKDQTASS